MPVAQTLRLADLRTGAVRDGIAWTADGKQAAVRVRAIDNKDSWLATVDLANAALLPAHRSSKNAWVNRRGGEFGWLPDNASYPMERHGFVQPEAWYDQYRRICQLFQRTLK